MDKKDKYRIIIIVSYILLIIFSVILLVVLWNKFSMNPDVQVGAGLYFLVFTIIVLASAIFILHLLAENHVSYTREPETELTEDAADTVAEQSVESFVSPFNVDIDLLARNIVPKIDIKESTGDYAERILINLARHFEIVQGIIFLKNTKTKEFESLCTFAYASDKDPSPFMYGDGIPGQVAKNKTLLNLSTIPEGYLKIKSGLGNASPGNLIFIPLLLNMETIGIIELASFHMIDKKTEWTFQNMAKIIGNAINTKIKSAAKK